MDSNIPEAVKQQIISDFMEAAINGEMFCYKGSNLTVVKELVRTTAESIETHLEDAVVDGAYVARANKGYPLEIVPYSPEAAQWLHEGNRMEQRFHLNDLLYNTGLSSVGQSLM